MSMNLPKDSPFPVSKAVRPRPTMQQIEKLMLGIGGKIQFPGGGPDIPEFPLTHRFFPGLYVREIFMPAGGVIVTRIHKTTHPFVVLTGHCYVYGVDGSVVELKAPHIGTTTPGTQRFLYMLEDTRWITFHPTDKTTVLDVENDIVEPFDRHCTSLEPGEVTRLLEELA